MFSLSTVDTGRTEDVMVRMTHNSFGGAIRSISTTQIRGIFLLLHSSLNMKLEGCWLVAWCLCGGGIVVLLLVQAATDVVAVSLRESRHISSLFTKPRAQFSYLSLRHFKSNISGAFFGVPVARGLALFSSLSLFHSVSLFFLALLSYDLCFVDRQLRLVTCYPPWQRRRRRQRRPPRTARRRSSSDQPENIDIGLKQGIRGGEDTFKMHLR